jgi:hypothetical protein
LNETRGILKQFHDLIKSYGAIDGHDRVNMLEIYLSPEEILPYYEVSDYPFNFAFIGLLGDLDAQRILYSINEWLDNLPEGRVANWVVIVEKIKAISYKSKTLFSLEIMTIGELHLGLIRS